MPDDIIERARQRFSELSIIIEKAEKVRDEHAQLGSFLAMAQRVTESLSPTRTGPASEEEIEHHSSQNGSVGILFPDEDAISTAPSSIPERAEKILRQRGPLHLSELFTEMRKQGWKATGDDTRDKRNLASSLWTRKGDRFNNLGNNVWEVVRKGNQ